MEWGGEVCPPDIDNIAHEKHNDDTKQKIKDVTLIQLKEFIKNVVGTIEIPMGINNSNISQIVMKMDIKGSEVNTIHAILFSGDFKVECLKYINWNR